MPKIMMALLCVMALLMGTSATARVYKCKDVDGNITYSQTTCAASSEQRQLTNSRTASSANGKAVDVTTCNMVGEAAREVFSAVKAGKDAQAIINSYGGLNGINPRMLNLVNYVGSFRAHDGIDGARVSQLSVSKCSNGGFGPITVNDLQFRDPMLAQQASIASQRQQVAKQYQQLAVPALISVDFQQTPLPEALRTIASKAGVAFDIDPSVSGQVSLRMDNTPWPQIIGRLAIEHKLLMGQGPDGIMISAMPGR